MADANAIITQAANAHGIPPSILYGVFGQESDYGKAAPSNPFQLEPGTARSLGVKNPANFQEAANGAAKYLAEYKGRGTGGMLSAYNAGPAGAYQPEYVSKVLAHAAAYDGKEPVSIPAPTGTTPLVPSGKAVSTTTETPNAHAAGFQMLASLLRSEKGGSENPLIATGVIDKAAAPSIKQTPAGRVSAGAPAVPGGPSVLPQAPVNLSKPPSPPVKVSLPPYITGKGFPAVERAKAALERADHHPVNVQELTREVDAGQHAKHAEIIATTPHGNVHKTPGGPVFVPNKPRVQLVPAP